MCNDPSQTPPEQQDNVADRETVDEQPSASTPKRRQIKIGSQRDDFKPVKRGASVQETWPTTESQAAESEPGPQQPADGSDLSPARERLDDEAPAQPRAPVQAQTDAPAEARPVVQAEAPPELGAPAETRPAVQADGVVEPEAPKASAAPGPGVERQPETGRWAGEPEEFGPIPPGTMFRSEDELEAEIDAVLEDASLDEASFEAMMTLQDTSDAQVELEPESRHRAEVVKVDREDVFFTLGTRNEGVASLRQFDEPPRIGAKMDVIVTRFDAEEGLYEVAVPGTSVVVGNWSDLAEGVLVEATVTGHNKGGLECTVNSIRGFIPASQISLFRVEDFDEYVDQRLQCVVTEADPDRRNLVLSRRAALEREREAAIQKLWEELDVGQVREGIVRRLHDFGAFVDLGGVDGLIHISQLSWDRVEHPSEVLQEGQQVRVRIERIDRQAEKIGLSYRDLLENPWTNVATKYPVGAMVSGTVSRLTKFGAFVKLEPGVEGLIHVSELAHHHVHRVQHVVSEGQEVEVKVLSVDSDAQRIGLSLKAALPEPEIKPQETPIEEQIPDGTRQSAVPKSSKPLKGGVDRPSGGEDFGLKW